MKTLPIVALAIFLFPAHGEEFKNLKVDYAAKAEFVERLSKMKLSNINIEKKNLSAAISEICNGNEAKGQPPIVSFVVSFPSRDISADPFSDDPTEKAEIDPLVSYHADDAPFTAVLDSICGQARYMWSIADDGKGRDFLLIEYKDK